MRIENVCSCHANSAHKPVASRHYKCTTSVKFEKVKRNYIKITLFKFDVCGDR